MNLSGVEVWNQASSRGVAPVPATRAALTSSVNLYPNPLVGGEAQVQIEATVPQADKAQVQVLNTMGVKVASAMLSFPAGTSSQPLVIGSLQPGPYIVRFVSGALSGTSLNLLKKE